MITDTIIDAKREAALEIVRIVLETYYPLIRQQVLKEVNDAIGKHEADGSFDAGYWAGVLASQRIVCDMMEGGE
jgi:hypothetical protein